MNEGTITAKRSRILVVDDDPDIVELLYLLLEDDYEVIRAYNGSEAIEHVLNDHPDVVLLDYMMPDMSGYDVLRSIKKEHNVSFVIIVTGQGSEKVAVDMMRAGASDYITKPFRNDQILDVVRNTLKIREVTLRNWQLTDELLYTNRRLSETAKSLEITNINLSQKLDDLMRLQRLSTDINRVTDVELLLDQLLRSMREHFGFAHSLIGLIDVEDASTVHTSATLGRFSHENDTFRLLEQPLVRRALAEHRVVCDKGPQCENSGFTHDTTNVFRIAIPLTTQSTLIGMYYGESEGPAKTYESNRDLFITVANQLVIAVKNAQLFEQVSKSYLDTTFALATAIEAKDQVTKGHIERVTRYAIQLGLALNLDDAEMITLQFGATLHDIGKLGISDKILCKPGRLNDEEMEIIKQHPIIGENIISTIEFLEPVRHIVKYHHERWDGTGYPEGLAGEDIPLYARLISIVDVFDVLTHDRPYKRAFTWKDAIGELKAYSGKQFDPHLLALFIDNLDKFPLMPKNGTARINTFS